jgi:sirohydrochlorin cobaltochelatase
MVIGHGSRLPYNKNTIIYQAEELTKMGYENVRYAFNEFDEPQVEEVFDEMIQQGIDEMIVLPLFISLGVHLRHDIPGKIRIGDGAAEGVFRHNGRNVMVRYAAPVGSDQRLTDMIAAKITGRERT